MALWDPPSPPDNLLAPPFSTKVLPPPTAFHPIGPLILQVSPPPGSSNPKKFYYDLSPDVTQGSFVATRAFFMANGHKVKILECPDLNTFAAASPGAVIRWLSELQMLFFSKGGWLLAIAGLISIVSGFALGGGTPTVTLQLFLGCYSEVPPPSWPDSSFPTVLPSHGTSVLPVQGGSPPAPAQVHHGGPPSCPDPVGVNVALSARLAALLRFGGHGLHYNPYPQYIRSSPALCMGNIPYDYGGFFHTAPPPRLWLLPSWP
jgi:hypothetical protein